MKEAGFAEKVGNFPTVIVEIETAAENAKLNNEIASQGQDLENLLEHLGELRPVDTEALVVQHRWRHQQGDDQHDRHASRRDHSLETAFGKEGAGLECRHARCGAEAEGRPAMSRTSQNEVDKRAGSASKAA